MDPSYGWLTSSVSSTIGQPLASASNTLCNSTFACLYWLSRKENTSLDRTCHVDVLLHNCLCLLASCLPVSLLICFVLCQHDSTGLEWPARAGISAAPVPHMGRGKGTPLTSSMVSRAVYELLEYWDSASLRELRLVLQDRTCIGLTSQKSFIRQVAEHTFATLTCGLDFMHLPLEQVARLRDPYLTVCR